jgi:hypothetical protein
MNFYINGVYDSKTLETLKVLGIINIGLDLRPFSLNLITFSEIKKNLPLMSNFKTSLIFENDAQSTIDSFLDLIGKKDIVLQFRDQRSANFYRQFDRKIEWMFHPCGEWNEILSLDNLQGVILPLEWKAFYQNNPSLWHVIEKRRLQVHIYASSLKQSNFVENYENLSLALDLGPDFSDSYRKINQDKLRKLKEWNHRNETLTGQ